MIGQIHRSSLAVFVLHPFIKLLIPLTCFSFLFLLSLMPAVPPKIRERSWVLSRQPLRHSNDVNGTLLHRTNVLLLRRYELFARNS